MALLAAFALYRLQALTKILDEDAMHLNDAFSEIFGANDADIKNFVSLAAQQNWKKYVPEIDRVRRRRPDISGLDARAQARMVRLPLHFRQLRCVFGALSIALVLTAIVIIGAVMALADSNSLSAHIAWDGVWGLIACLVSYVGLIITSLARTTGFG
jgi:hypothetical protein